MASLTICPRRAECMVLRKHTKVWEQMGPERMAGNHSLCGATRRVAVWACSNLQWDRHPRVCTMWPLCNLLHVAACINTHCILNIQQ